MKEPLVSVLLPVHNDRGNLSETMESVQSQTFQEFELIIIDDASTDDSRHLIKLKQENDNRIRLIENEINLGITKSLNKALRISKGKFIARIDEGDLWEIEKLSRQIKYLQRYPKCVLVGSKYETYSESGYLKKTATDLPVQNEDIKYWLFKGLNPMLHSSIVFRNNGLLYNDAASTSQDFELYLRLFFMGSMHNINETLVKYHIEKKSISSENYHTQFYNHLQIHRQFLQCLVGRGDRNKFVNIGVDFKNTPILLSIRKKYMKIVSNKVDLFIPSNIVRKLFKHILIPDMAYYTIYRKLLPVLYKKYFEQSVG